MPILSRWRLFYSDSYSGLSGYNALQALWEQGLRPDAVFGGSDGLTSGASRFLYERALRIPDDISVLGYEDSTIGRICNTGTYSN